MSYCAIDFGTSNSAIAIPRTPTEGPGMRLVPLEGGKQLQVRGYIGPFYRTQVWQRIE